MIEDVKPEAKAAMDNIEGIAEAVKHLKSASKKMASRTLEEEKARDEARELMQQAHAVTGAMMETRDPSEQKALMEKNQAIQKYLAKANNKIDKAIDKARKDAEAVNAAYDALIQALKGTVVESSSENGLPAEEAPPEALHDATT